MDELEEARPSNVGTLITAVVVGIVFFIGGRAYQSYKDKSGMVIFNETVRVYREMQDVSTFPSYKGGEMMQRLEVQNTVDGIGYIEIHYIPANALPKPHEDIGNPEQDGQAPTKDADDWAKGKDK